MPSRRGLPSAWDSFIGATALLNGLLLPQAVSLPAASDNAVATSDIGCVSRAMSRTSKGSRTEIHQ